MFPILIHLLSETKAKFRTEFFVFKTAELLFVFIFLFLFSYYHFKTMTWFPQDSLAEVEEKHKKAMVSNAELDNEKTNFMYMSQNPMSFSLPMLP